MPHKPRYYPPCVLCLVLTIGCQSLTRLQNLFCACTCSRLPSDNHFPRRRAKPLLVCLKGNYSAALQPGRETTHSCINTAVSSLKCKTRAIRGMHPSQHLTHRTRFIDTRQGRSTKASTRRVRRRGMDFCILMLRNLLLRTTLSREQALFTLAWAFHFAYCTIHTDVDPPSVVG